MAQDIVATIQSNPDYQELVRSRRTVSRTLTVILLVAYYGLILLIAFAPDILGTPIADGYTTTIGMPLGVGIIILSFLLTAIYVVVANSKYDRLIKQIKESVR